MTEFKIVLIRPDKDTGTVDLTKDAYNWEYTGAGWTYDTVEAITLGNLNQISIVDQNTDAVTDMVNQTNIAIPLFTENINITLQGMRYPDFFSDENVRHLLKTISYAEFQWLVLGNNNGGQLVVYSGSKSAPTYYDYLDLYLRTDMSIRRFLLKNYKLDIFAGKYCTLSLTLKGVEMT